MKIASLFSIALAAIAISCDNVPAQNNDYENHQVSQAAPAQAANHSGTAQNQNSGNDRITLHPVRDSKTGRVSMQVPLPQSWTIIEGAQSGQPAVRGPNGLVITIFQPQSFYYTNVPDVQMIYQNTGQMAAPVGINNVMQQQIIPQGQQMGMTLQNQYMLNDVAAKDAEYVNQLIGAGQGQNSFQAMGSDWIDRDGKKVCVVVHYHEIPSSYVIKWGFNLEMLKVDAAGFTQAKNDYIFGMANKVFNQNEINAFNAKLAEQQRMDNARFQASQEEIIAGSKQRSATMAATTEHINNTTQVTYESRQHNQEIFNEQQSNFVRDVNVVVSPIDGNEYEVESGSAIYWINKDGRYIMSDDPGYDPNDNEIHPDVWQKAPKKEYK